MTTITTAPVTAEGARAASRFGVAAVVGTIALALAAGVMWGWRVALALGLAFVAGHCASWCAAVCRTHRLDSAVPTAYSPPER